MFPFSISRQRLLLGITLGLSILLMFVSSTWHDAFAQSGPYLSWYAQDPALQHLIGRAVSGSTTDWEVQASDGSNVMQYGPYVSGLQPGNNVATWTLMVDNNSGSQSVVRLDVNDATSNGILAQIYLTRQQWTAANTFQDFTLPFTVNSGNVSDRIELRVWTLGVSYVREQKVSLTRTDSVNLALYKPTIGDGTCATGEDPSMATDGNSTTKWCARDNNGQHWLQVDLVSNATIARFVVSHASSGGESTDLNTRNFTIQVSPDATNWTTVVTVTGNTSAQTTHIISPVSTRYVKLVTTIPSINDGAQAARIYELQVFGTNGATPTPTATPTLTSTPVPMGNQPTMADYWSGTAHWKFDRKLTWSGMGQQGVYDGSSLKIIGTTWYLFDRLVHTELPACALSSPLGTQVRKSTDQGYTWSTPIEIIAPTANTAWSCAATDGDVYYNPNVGTGGTWYYLIQCLAGGSWSGCAFTRTGADPMGVFTPVANNPVIHGHDLWDHICDVATDDCVIETNNMAHQVYDEGTFDIFQFDGTYYWVTFHGAANANSTVLGFRGMAKTTDFVHWLAGNQSADLPQDAVLDRNDAANFNWRENWLSGGPIGAGAGSILFDNGYYYQIAEFPDVGLNCLENQHWDIGMFRSASLTNVNWDQYPGFGDPNHPTGNPIIYSSTAIEGQGIPPCNIQYMHLFKDPNTGITYLEFGRHSIDPNYDGMYFYRLDNAPNMLINSDFWRADTYAWSAFGTTTNLVASRVVNNSPDGSPYLSLNCGGSCTGDHSVYQDVAVPASYQGKPFTFGGQFATDAGSGNVGNLSLVIWQFDSSGAQITSNQVRYPITVNTSYANYQATGTIAANAAKLRYQVYMSTDNINFRADNLYLIPTLGGT